MGGPGALVFKKKRGGGGGGVGGGWGLRVTVTSLHQTKFVSSLIAQGPAEALTDSFCAVCR